MSFSDGHPRPLVQRLIKAAWPHYLFVTGMILKGLDGVLELAGGLMLLTTGLADLRSFSVWLTHGELLEDPNSLIANYLLHLSSHLSSHGKLFVSLYLIGHGVLKLFLVISLVRHRHWAFPVALAVLIGFIGYQAIVLAWRSSPALAMTTGFDAVVVILVWMEFLRVRRRW